MVLTRHFIPALILFCLLAPLRAGEPQTWINTSVSQRLDYGLEAAFEAEQWLASDSPVYRHYELTPQLIWHYSPSYDFIVGVESSKTWDAMEEETDENTGLVAVNIKLPLKRLNLQSRQRFQAGYEDERDVFFFRQRTVADYDFGWFQGRLKPFLADEWFFDIRNGFLSENRAQVGLSYQFNKATRFELYGMRDDQWSSMGNLNTTPVVGVSVSFGF
ncbi:MAG: DUF2490 domain-containing protein [Verrucomicrobiae bacterium]|nr:DUF2490 domain-containing protein [Verrucomicrobiae bacterium]